MGATRLASGLFSAASPRVNFQQPRPALYKTAAQAEAPRLDAPPLIPLNIILS